MKTRDPRCDQPTRQATNPELKGPEAARPVAPNAALNSPNETDRKTRARNTGQGPEPQGGTGWDGLSLRLSLPLRC